MNRFNHYLERSRHRRGAPIQHAEEIGQSTDNKIDQDHPGFPHGQSSKDLITPATPAEQKTADPELTDKNRPAKNGAADEERLKSKEEGPQDEGQEG